MSFCTECGTKLPNGAKYCSSCGARIGDGNQDITPDIISEVIFNNSKRTVNAVRKYVEATNSFNKNGKEKGGNQNIERFIDSTNEYLAEFENIVLSYEWLFNEIRNIIQSNSSPIIKMVVQARKVNIESYQGNIKSFEDGIITKQKFIASFELALSNPVIKDKLVELIDAKKKEISISRRYIHAWNTFIDTIEESNGTRRPNIKPEEKQVYINARDEYEMSYEECMANDFVND